MHSTEYLLELIPVNVVLQSELIQVLFIQKLLIEFFLPDLLHFFLLSIPVDHARIRVQLRYGLEQLILRNVGIVFDEFHRVLSDSLLLVLPEHLLFLFVVAALRHNHLLLVGILVEHESAGSCLLLHPEGLLHGSRQLLSIVVQQIWVVSFLHLHLIV